MKRTVDLELYGKTYPLCCSLGAVEEIEEKFGSMDNYVKAAGSGSIRSVIDVLRILMKHGAKRAKQFDGVDVEVIDDLETYLDLSDIPEISKKIVEAISISRKNEVAGVPEGKKKVTE